MERFHTEKSKALFEDTCNYLVDGVASSFHRAPGEEYPIVMEYGKGSKLYDVDGNEYIDYNCAMGPVILGYNNAELIEAVTKQLQKGTQFAAPTPQLNQLAKKLTEIIPCTEKVMFQNSGTEAVMCAWRVARAYTGKNKIVKFEGQYHGWSDEEKVTIDADSVEELGPIDNIYKIINTKGQRIAAADDIIVAPWNDLEALEKILKQQSNDIAAVAMEPFMCDSGPILPQPGYLQGAKDLCEKYNVLLHFDEVITGFRMALGGAQQYYNVIPHIATFAKAITGGYPLAVVAGRKDIMDAGVHASGTFNGNPVSVVAALATIGILERPGVYEKFQKLGDRLCHGFEKLSKKHHIPLFCAAKGSIVELQLGTAQEATTFRDFLQKADIEKYQKLFHTAKAYGVRITPLRGRIYLTTAHTEEDIDKTIEILDVVFSQI